MQFITKTYLVQNLSNFVATSVARSAMVEVEDLLQASMGCHQVAMLVVQRIPSHGIMAVYGFQVVVDLI